MFLVHRPFSSCSRPGADDSNCVLKYFGVNHQDQASRDRSNSKEAVLHVGMKLVENFKVIYAGVNKTPASSNEIPCFFRLALFFVSSQTTSTLVQYKPATY